MGEILTSFKILNLQIVRIFGYLHLEQCLYRRLMLPVVLLLLALGS